MFSYDPILCAAVRTPTQSVLDVLGTLQTIDATCSDGDGLKWFNWLYLQVTQAVQKRIAFGGFHDPAWLSELDVQFARLYFTALEGALSFQTIPACWRVLFDSREMASIARIQFALAGINAHINHDLPQAIVATCKLKDTRPRHGTTYFDYTALNATLDSLVETAKQGLHVRLPGDALPAASHLENLLAAWNVSAAREAAWNNAELLWHLGQTPPLDSTFIDTLDGLTTVANKTLLFPVPP
jgi:hypothetical protein